MEQNSPPQITTKELLNPLPVGPSYPVVKQAVLQTNKYFLGAVYDLSFSILLLICAFVPFWVFYIQALGSEHTLVFVAEWLAVFSLQVLVIFALSLYLFNQTHPNSQLKLWSFTKEITWPWLWEGVKASVIIFFGCLALFIPGFIKTIHYTFFSFVVFFNRRYKEGKISALKHSKHLSKGFRWWILLSYVLYYGVHFSLGEVKNMVLDLGLPDWSLYITLAVYTYVLILPCVYLLSVFYFVYAARDKEQMTGAA